MPREETVAEYRRGICRSRSAIAIGRSIRLRRDAAQQRELQAKLAQADFVPCRAEFDRARCSPPPPRCRLGLDPPPIRRGPPAADDEAAWIADPAGSLTDALSASGSRSRRNRRPDLCQCRRRRPARRTPATGRRQGHADRAKQADVEELQRQEADLRSRWLPSGSPVVSNPFRRRHATLADRLSGGLRDGQPPRQWIAERDRLRQRETAFEKRLRTASGRTDSDVAVLLAAAHHAVEQAKEHRRRTADLHQSLELPSRGWPPATRRRRSWIATGRLACRVAIGSHSIETSGRLGDRTGSQGHRAAVGDAGQIGWPAPRGSSHSGNACADRPVRIEVGPLAQRLAPELPGDPPELALAKLSDQLDRAIEAQKQHDQLEKNSPPPASKSSGCDVRCATLLAGQTDLFAKPRPPRRPSFSRSSNVPKPWRRLDVDVERPRNRADPCRRRSRTIRDNRSPQSSKPSSKVNAAIWPSGCKRPRGKNATPTGLQPWPKTNLPGSMARGRPPCSPSVGPQAGPTGRRRRPLRAAAVGPAAVGRISAAFRAREPARVDRHRVALDRRDDGRALYRVRSLGSRSQGNRSPPRRRRRTNARPTEHRDPGTTLSGDPAGLVLHYCRQNEPLPIVMDDVLVNFDLQRNRVRHSPC